jgi:hypothetical protein
MDPMENLREQREIAGRLISHRAPRPAYEDVQRLAELALALDEWRLTGGFDPYLPPVEEDDVPTHVQALALGRFLRGHWRREQPRNRFCHISRGGAGLPDSYLLVRFADGYEGGIDREGNTST